MGDFFEPIANERSGTRTYRRSEAEASSSENALERPSLRSTLVNAALRRPELDVASFGDDDAFATRDEFGQDELHLEGSHEPLVVHQGFIVSPTDDAQLAAAVEQLRDLGRVEQTLWLGIAE